MQHAALLLNSVTRVALQLIVKILAFDWSICYIKVKVENNLDNNLSEREQSEQLSF